jgi:adenosylhomocysteine nucleosidase
MKFGIICAGDIEFAPFIPMFKDCIVVEKAMLNFYCGKIEGKNVIALYSGSGKVNSAIASQLLIDIFSCNCIINSGTAGAMRDDLEIFDTVISNETAYHDVSDDVMNDFHPWLKSVYFKADEKLLSAAQKVVDKKNCDRKIVFGRMVTGEQFITDENSDKINNVYSPFTVDMETAAIAHVCYVNQTPFISVRTITDTPKQRGLSEVEKNCKMASQLSAEFVRELLMELNKG